MQSQTVIYYSYGAATHGLQLAPDEKIYGCRPFIDSLSIINTPNIQGIGCNFQLNGISLAGRVGYNGLPQFLQKYKAYLHYKGDCQWDSIHFSGDIWPPADSIHWDFGDPASGAANYSTDTTPSHSYALPGQYTVELFVRHMDNRTDTSWVTITIYETPAPELGNDTTICQGDSVTFDAGFCTGCTYEWASIPPGFSSGEQIVTLDQTGIYTVAVTSPDGCTGRDTVQLTVTVPPAVTNSPLSKSICSGESTNILLTATLPNTTFSWTASGSSPFVTGFSPGTGDTIDQVLLNTGPGDETVTYTITPAVGGCIGDSVQYIVTVIPGDSVSVLITTSADSVCEGTPVTFTAFPVNGGASPTFQWIVNGTPQGANDSVFIYAPVDNDSITCLLTSSDTICSTNNPATSNAIIIRVHPILSVGISITPSGNPVCEGIPVTFTATPVNGGTTPVFQWQVNGINVGSNNPLFTYYPASGDLVSCTLTSSEPCTSNNPASSNPVIMTVVEAPTVTFIPCFDTITTTDAKPIRLKGGIPLGGTYSGTGVTNGYFYPALADQGTHQISYTYTNFALCSQEKTLNIHVFPSSLMPCGSWLVDIRDSTVYPTVQIGSQCWFAADLDYGVQIPESIHQRDNCIPEKYKSAVGSRQPALYQWDEVMQYSDTSGPQGLCPPGWHIPTETDWNILFANWTNNAFAGAPLKYSGFSGFNAFLNGAGFFNQGWWFGDFAAFFWSSTSHGPWKAWAHGMNDYDFSVSYYPSYRANAFSVRCMKDQ
ncbi:MAG: FISUMP domain-containing protein [Bacteroidota bacterium]